MHAVMIFQKQKDDIMLVLAQTRAFCYTWTRSAHK